MKMLKQFCLIVLAISWNQLKPNKNIKNQKLIKNDKLNSSKWQKLKLELKWKLKLITVNLKKLKLITKKLKVNSKY